MNDIFKMAEQAYHALSIAESELKRLYKENAELKNSLNKSKQGVSTTDLRKAAQLALEALEDVFGLEKKDVGAIQALRQALAQPVDAVNTSAERVDETAKREHDLVYRLRKRAEIRRQVDTRKSVQEGKPDRIADLLEEAADYIEKREWVGLTDEVICSICDCVPDYDISTYDLIQFARIIEAKLKEKNHG
jgi:hypothetical protein